MKVVQTKLAGCFLIEPKIITDARGYFMESFNEAAFNKEIGQDIHFVQDNQSFSSKGVLRGLHYQKGIDAQSKLVRVSSGEVLDVVVDIRPESPTFGEYLSVLLSAENQLQFFIPKGFAHGFLVLSETATFFYKCDNFYNSSAEAGIIYNDPKINIDWQMPLKDLIISDKDKAQPLLENADSIW